MTTWSPTCRRRSSIDRLITREETAGVFGGFFPFFKEITMFEMLLREATMLMAQVHDMLMRINDGFELQLGDKDLHFIIMALLGMALFFVVHFVFSRLAKISVTAISFIYVFTVMAVLGFAVEIGQKISGTGEMDFADIVAGLYGVLVFFGLYSAYRLIAWALGKLFHRP